MNAVLFAFSAAGRDTARRIRDLLEAEGAAVELCVSARFAAEDCRAYAGGLASFTGTVFDRDALIFVGAAGIALRAVAPHVASKLSDPAVLCLDERGRFVIPLLSGHIGGANRLANRLAAALGAVPVVTTATDVNGRFSVDTWASEHGMAISSMALAKRVSAQILERDLPIRGDRPLPGRLPEGLVPGEAGELGISVSVHTDRPFAHTLLLVPRVLTVGIGCRRDTPRERIEAAVDSAFHAHNLNPAAVAGAASIDVKADEAGLLAFCKSRGWPIQFYPAAVLEAVPGAFSTSEFVKRTVGVDNVCERAALAGGGRLIVRKTAMDGVTVAVAEKEWGIEFE